jgi:hypothetical protein
MAVDFRSLFNNALRDERRILRPHFYGDEFAEPQQLVVEDTYVRLRLTRMFLQHQREFFRTHYPVVHAVTRFAGLDGPVEAGFVARPELAGEGDEKDLDQVVTLDQTLLGPVLYRGGDLDLLIGLYAAPADDWAQRFIGLAEGISQLTLNAALTTAISMASTVKKAVEDTLGGDGFSLRLGLDQELRERRWLAPGYLVMVAAPEEDVDYDALVVEDGELLTQHGEVYDDHDYIVLAIEVTETRSDWQSLGYGHQWQSLLRTAAEADDAQQVKDAYLTFSGAIMGSEDLSWSDRSAIVALAQQRVKQIREARVAPSFLEGLRGADTMEELITADAEALPAAKGVEQPSPAELLATDWIA